MEYEVMLIERRDGWYLDINSEKILGYPLSEGDFTYAKTEAKMYARQLGLEKITVIDLLGFERKIYLD